MYVLLELDEVSLVLEALLPPLPSPTSLMTCFGGFAVSSMGWSCGACCCCCCNGLLSKDTPKLGCLVIGCCCCVFSSKSGAVCVRFNSFCKMNFS